MFDLVICLGIDPLELSDISLFRGLSNKEDNIIYLAICYSIFSFINNID
jgi:hypothetical protein